MLSEKATENWAKASTKALAALMAINKLIPTDARLEAENELREAMARVEAELTEDKEVTVKIYGYFEVRWDPSMKLPWPPPEMAALNASLQVIKQEYMTAVGFGHWQPTGKSEIE